MLSTVTVAVLAALTAVYRPARLSPLSGLREAEIEHRAMPPGRLAAAALTLALAGAVWKRYELETEAGQNVNGAMGLALFLLISAWLLTPLLVRLLVAPAALPGLLLSRYSGRLAAVTSVRAVRRVAAMTGPVLIAVGLSAMLLSNGAASDAIARSQTAASAPTRVGEGPAAKAGEAPARAAKAEVRNAGNSDVSTTELRERQRRNEVGTRVLMVPLIVFSALGILNTLLLATRQRRREFAVLRMAGATGAQLLRMLFWESVMVVGGGVLAAGAVLGVFLSVLSRRLEPYGVDLDTLVPCEVMVQMASYSAVLGLVGVVAPGALVLRVRAVQAARTRD
ncbi:FtsX-like permease family protein [Streptomyces sp. BBFR102]|uniref:FtsX-like permease family protein n=1 Tax=Streptomyces sp. BBFR102 TaxID=3448171 RepID=UPI003F52D623